MEPNRLLNRRSGVLHLWPAWEPCNTDAIPYGRRLLGFEPFLRAAPGYRRDCRRCFPSK